MISCLLLVLYLLLFFSISLGKFFSLFSNLLSIAFGKLFTLFGNLLLDLDELVRVSARACINDFWSGHTLNLIQWLDFSAHSLLNRSLRWLLSLEKRDKSRSICIHHLRSTAWSRGIPKQAWLDLSIASVTSTKSLSAKYSTSCRV